MAQRQETLRSDKVKLESRIQDMTLNQTLITIGDDEFMEVWGNPQQYANKESRHELNLGCLD